MKLPAMFAALGILMGGGAAAQNLPLLIHQELTPYNYRSQAGMPISTISNVPPGSDGRMTITNSSAGSVNLPANQFRGMLSSGGVIGLRSNDWARLKDFPDLQAGTSPFSAAVATEMSRPLAYATPGDNSSPVVMVMRQAQIGLPFVSRRVSFDFGSEIAPPLTDERGVLLTNSLSAGYWLAQPYIPTNGSDTAQGFYWSPNARRVFAIQTGPIAVTWIKASGYSLGSPPPYTNVNGSINFLTNGGSLYELYTQRYVVSGSPVKPAQKMYWTEKPFNNSGQLVSVPQGSVAAVNVIYNNNFPEKATTPFVDPYTPPIVDPTNSLQELRTLWYENNVIHAFNIEGRAFVEVLGELNPDNSRRFLGFEIVDVFREPNPVDVVVELGERVPAYQDGRDDSELFPSPLLNTPQKFYYRQTDATGDRATLYATYATANLNDFQAYWLTSGVAGLRWPYLLNRYHEVWPDAAAKYSHYLRTLVATEAEAAATAVQLPGNEAPQLLYQDPLPTPLGAKLDVTGRFYTFLDQDHPAHRTLLRFNAGNNIAFERVFSWLDLNLKSGDFAGTLVADLNDYQLRYNNYLTASNNYIAASNSFAQALSRGVNGDWNLYLAHEIGFSASGSIASWSLLVDTIDPETGAPSTQEFTQGSQTVVDFLVMPTQFAFYVLGSPFPSTITVSGITQQVAGVRVKLNGFSHDFPQVMGAYLQPPGGATIECPLMSFVGGPPVTDATLVFDDSAPNSILSASQITSGTYRPSLSSDPSSPTSVLVLQGFQEVQTLAALLGPPPADPAHPPVPPGPMSWPDPTALPAVVEATVNVGDRITAPEGELGSTGNYFAGYILVTNGNSFNAGAYRDPFVAGFDQANLGAIIPVNAIPGRDSLEVWWFRQNKANANQGFQPIFWPAVIGHYKLRWPESGDEIVLASNDGSGPLASLQAKGSIYRQTDPAQPGYNPNEEHALLLGGQAYALCDDLNNTNAGPDYSSAPYVLLDYIGPDGRPAMRAFHVLREKPEAGILFDYVVDAGSILQAPMPLPLLAPPVEGSGHYANNFNTEPPGNSGDLPVGWNNSMADSPLAHYARFTYEDRKHEFWVYRGLHAGLPALEVGQYNPNSDSFNPLPAATAIVGQPFTYFLHVSRRPQSLTMNALNLPTGISIYTSNGLAIAGTPLQAGSNQVTIIVQDLADNSVVTNSFLLTVVASGVMVSQPPLAITSLTPYSATSVTYYDRPPFLAHTPTSANSFTMRFYYKTEPTFDWPGIANPPAPGSIVPYLLPRNTSGQLIGIPTSQDSASLDIVYRPVWPSLVNNAPLPTLFSGETLTDPKRGMAAIRGQSSLQVLYQQSIGLNVTSAPVTVVLHDPTVQKTASWSDPLPASIISRAYLGKYYFPNLPPNLVNRVFYDPNSKNLVLKGEFVNEPVGEKYLFLNLLRDADLAAVKGLCPDTDTANKTAWDALVGNLSTPVYTFHEDPNIPGSYVADPNATVTRSVSDLVEITSSDTPVDSYALGATGPGTGYVTYIAGNGHDPAHAGEPVSVYIIRVAPPLYPGELKVIPDPNPLSESISFQHTADLAGRAGEYEYDWRIAPPVDGQPPVNDPTNWPTLVAGANLDHYTMEGKSGIQSLSDNYVALRYRSINPLSPRALTNWSTWTQPKLAEGWIKRVLAGINPFNQRTSDLFNNPANTTANIISQAGHRWEGDVALNLDSLNRYGLIEIYETLLNRGKAISVNAAGGGINYGPANDALLLAAGYLNDLYMFVGNDAWADAANPTIGIGTADRTYGNIATALFAFKGQEASLLDEEQALLRGRDDFLAPGVLLTPVYNRLFWNYTRGIDAGEVIYTLNYNILDQNNDGVVNAADAAILYPQGHGDAYGHYLTALSGYYSLLMNPNFDWVPRIEAVTVLGAAVSVDYQDERKFASAAAALARTGRQVFDLAWRHDYQPGTGSGWDYFGQTRSNAQRTYSDAGTPRNVTRFWGMDHWAIRVNQGAFLNWVVGNAILPPVDPDSNHEGIQKVDRTTVPELRELTATADQIQSDFDNAEAGFTPLGLSQNAIPFDINPLEVTGLDPKTHFEQVYGRAVTTLNNAVVAFNDAQNVTELMRSEEDSLANLQAATTNQELAYINQLIELYGSPYPDDKGPGKTYAQDYTGPDLFHYTYVENPDTNNFNGVIPDPTVPNTFYVDIQALSTTWYAGMISSLADLGINTTTSTDGLTTNAPGLNIPFNIGPNGFFDKPLSWTSQRESPGKIQQAISELIAARNKLRKTIVYETYDKQSLDKAYEAFVAQMAFETNNATIADGDIDLQIAINSIQEGYAVSEKAANLVAGYLGDAAEAIDNYVPELLIAGLAFGGDQLKAVKAPATEAFVLSKEAVLAADVTAFIGTSAAATKKQNQILADTKTIAESQLDQDLKNGILALGNQELDIQGDLFTINEALRELDDAQRAYQALVAKGNRILQERLTFRQHAAALVQGFRTRDAAFRIFQNEKLERYKTLFDLAAKYAFLAAQAYDYETGLLNTDQGKSFLNRIISSRALGVVQDGQPQYAGSDTGDPGLSSALAEMKADWDVLKGRLGFNNPDGYGTTVSLRQENYRVLPGADGDNNWKDVLQRNQVADLLSDPDVKRSCLQIDDGGGQPVPGIVLTFSTVVSDGLNLFGQPYAPGDHNYSPSSFATKIFAAGVDFDGYIGMDNPTPGTTAGGVSPSDPTLDPNALGATPYVYLIAVGADSMRSPPLGDTSEVRSWNVDDLTVPLPFNIGASDFSSNPFYRASDSLTEPLFSVRKSQAFRPVSTTDAFSPSIYGANGALQPSQYTNKRLIGRSIWNSRWKLVIPGKTLLNDPNQGLSRFIATVKDIKLFFVTYSYAGN